MHPPNSELPVIPEANATAGGIEYYVGTESVGTPLLLYVQFFPQIATVHTEPGAEGECMDCLSLEVILSKQHPGPILRMHPLRLLWIILSHFGRVISGNSPSRDS